LEALCQEVRSSFATEDEIDLLSVQKLTYMVAVLNETMRKYPPAIFSSPRKIAEGGDVFLGRYVPAKVSLILPRSSLGIRPGRCRGSRCDERPLTAGVSSFFFAADPQQTVVTLWHWSLYNNDEFFATPELFIPERFLDDPRFANDRRDGFQPFSFGPRNCIGKKYVDKLKKR
jgi:cytochrome P450